MENRSHCSWHQSKILSVSNRMVAAMKKKSEEQRGTAELIKPSSNMTFRKASIFAATSPGNNVRKDKKQVAKTMTSLASPAERRVEINHR